MLNIWVYWSWWHCFFLMCNVSKQHLLAGTQQIICSKQIICCCFLPPLTYMRVTSVWEVLTSLVGFTDILSDEWAAPGVWRDLPLVLVLYQSCWSHPVSVTNSAAASSSVFCTDAVVLSVTGNDWKIFLKIFQSPSKLLSKTTLCLA